jgi:two-component system C4-dicarboxylate transport sensor histidine kinase DctB
LKTTPPSDLTAAPTPDASSGEASGAAPASTPGAATAAPSPSGPSAEDRLATLQHDNARLRELLGAAGRLAEFGRFAAQQVHELRQPLFAIRGLGQLLLERDRVDLEEVLDFARHIVDQSERLTALVNDLRQMSVPAPRHAKRRAEVDAILVRVMSLLDFRLRKGVRLRTYIAPNVPPVAAMPQALEQIVINLLANALDAVAGQPVAVIQVRARSLPENPGLVEVAIADNGNGVAKAVRARLFETFFTTKGDEQGTGLGLAVSRELARSAGGDLVLLEDPGPWDEPAVTVFSLTIPVLQEF